MLMDWAVKANLWAERHNRLLQAVTIGAFFLVCADYARFIDLPNIITLPVMVAGILTGIRYMLWEGWLKGQIDERTRAVTGAPAPEPSPRRQARAATRAARLRDRP